MKSLSSLGLGLSLVFGCLLLALVAELYYLLWWKKRITNRDLEDGYGSTAKEFLYMCCWKKPPSSRSSTLNPQDFCSSSTQVHEPQAQAQLNVNSNKNFWHKPSFGEEDSVEAEILRLQNFSGPPRFLFTIKEETKEDLESEDGKSRDRSRKGSKSRSLSDLLHLVETPYLTPIASPPYFTPPLTPVRSSHNQNMLNSFFGSENEADFNWLRSSPPKFQFLKDAEDKLFRRKFTEDAEIIDFHKMDESDQFKKAEVPSTSMSLMDEENGPFITLCVGKHKEGEADEVQHQSVLQYTTSNSSQVLPLASSPPASKLASSSNTTMDHNLHQIN